MFLPDTDTCIFLLRGNQSVKQKWQERSRQEVFISSIVAFELSVGPLLCPAKYRKRNEADLDRLLSTVLPLGFSQEDGEYAARVRVTLQKAGTPIGSYDTLLVGQALSRGMTLVSHNTAEFSRVEGLKLVDWSVRS